MTRKKRTARPAPAIAREIQLTTDVTIQGILENTRGPQPGQTKPRKTYTVRWTVAKKRWPKTFPKLKLAESFRSQLLSYANRGIPFDITSGLPEPMARQAAAVSWYQHATEFIDMKWPNLAAKSRQSMAEALTAATIALTATTRGRPDLRVLREALNAYAFVTPVRAAGPPPDDLAPAIAWISANTVSMADFEDLTQGAALARSVLNAIAILLDGSVAAANTISRKRAIVYGSLEYGIERGRLSSNPLDRVNWQAPKSDDVVDNRVVVNAKQAWALLLAVGDHKRGARLVAFFALMYFAGLRPSEALNVRTSHLTLPETGWGEVRLEKANPRSGTRWTNSGKGREEKELKHRAKKATRSVPLHPALVLILRVHLAWFEVPDGELLFLGPRGGLLAEWVYLEVWEWARTQALTPDEVNSPLANVPYSLRHAFVSTALNAGVPATQVAEWAGHSVAVLLRIYAKCIVGQEAFALKQLEQATEVEPSSPTQTAGPSATDSDEIAGGEEGDGD